MWHLVPGGLDVEMWAGVEIEATWCVSASLSSLGAITQVWQLPLVRFEVPMRRDTNAQTPNHTRPDEKAQACGRWKFQMCHPHTTAVWIIELSCSSWSTLWCAHSETLTCQTLQYTHIHGCELPFFSHVPESWADGLSTVRLSLSVVWNSEASTCLSPSQLRQRRHVPITEMYNPFVLLHIICYPNRWHWWWGWMIKLCYYLCRDISQPDWQMVGIVNNNYSLSYSIVVMPQWLHI